MIIIVKYVELKHREGYIRGLHHDNKATTIVIFFHGFTGNKNESYFMFSKHAKMFDQIKIDSIRLDYYGSGDSDGEFFEMDFWDLIVQGKKIIKYVQALGYHNIYLEGMSMGGSLALALASSEIAKLILVSPAINMKEITTTIFENSVVLPSGNISYKSLELSQKFKESIEEVDIFKTVVKLDIPTLIIQGTADLAVPYSNALKVKEKLKNAILVTVDGADHLYSEKTYRDILDTNILNFVR